MRPRAPRTWCGSSNRLNSGTAFPGPRMGKDARFGLAANAKLVAFADRSHNRLVSMTRRSAREEDQVHHSDQDLSELIATGKAQGYLTYDQVNEYLPDEAVNPDKLDSLLVALEDMGIELVEEAPEPRVELATFPADDAPPSPRNSSPEAEIEIAPDDDAPSSLANEPAKWSDDPVRMYLTQMAVIPLLTREEEISLAKKIEITRKRFRRTVLSSNLAMQNTV